MVNVAFTLLLVPAACVSAPTAASVVVWLWGVDSLASARFGLAVATPFITILLLVVQLLLVIAAMIAAGHRTVMPTVLAF